MKFFLIKYRYSDILLNKQKLHLSRLFCCNHTCYCVNMVSVTSASRYITSASRYHPRYKIRSSMYMRGLIPRNLAELTGAVPIVATLLPIIRLRRLSLTTVNSKNLCDNFIFANSVKRNVYDVKNSRLKHDLPTTVVLPFREDFFSRNFAKMKP